MNDNNLVNLETIPPGSKINIEISTDLYIRLQQLMLEALPYKDLQHFQLCLQEAHSNKPVDPLSYHLITILHILNLLETSARKAGIIQNKKFDLIKKEILQ